MADQPHHRRDTESYGLGQSGYTAGRREGDRALERNSETRNPAYAKALDDRPPDLGVDERWTGLGAAPWVPPDKTDEEKT